MARYKIKLLLALVAAVLLCGQCSNGYDGSLFPSFLVNIAFQRNVGDTFQRVTGAKFIIYAIPAPGANTEVVYIIQVLPGGARRLGIYSASLNQVGAAIDSQAVGAMHAQLDNFNNLTGMCINNFTGTLVSSLGGADVTLASYGECQDYFMVKNNPTFCMISPTVYSGGITYFYSQTFTFTGTLSPAGSQTSDLNAGGRNFILEAAGRSMGSTTCLLFRDANTDEGYLLNYTSDLPPSILQLSNLISIGRIVPGTAQMDDNGQPIVQTFDGLLRRFNPGGWSNDETDSTDFNRYIIAYGQNNSMYLFNPVTLDILKTRAWWNMNGY
jgi:hypothetical protein